MANPFPENPSLGMMYPLGVAALALQDGDRAQARAAASSLLERHESDTQIASGNLIEERYAVEAYLVTRRYADLDEQIVPLMVADYAYRHPNMTPAGLAPYSLSVFLTKLEQNDA